MRKNINYKTIENVRTMKAYIVDCMVEEDLRDYDDDFRMNIFGGEFSKSDLNAAYIEDVMETYEALIVDFRDGDYEMYDYVEESIYIEKYYNYAF